MFSDTRGGQNRNQNIAAVLFYAVQSIDHINGVEQKFLEQGHTYMECDSMHSSIEFAKRNTDVFCVSAWKSVFEVARRKNWKIHIRSTSSATKISLTVRHFRNPDQEPYQRWKWRNCELDEGKSPTLSEELIAYSISIDIETIFHHLTSLDVTDLLHLSVAASHDFRYRLPRRLTCRTFYLVTT